MRRAATLVVVFSVLTASAAWAAYSSLPVDDLMRPDPRMTSEVIVIRVPPQDLSRCIATLVQVMQMPLDPELVTHVSVDMPDTPMVRCEAE